MAKSNISIRPYEIGDEGAALEAALESVNEVGPFMPWCHRRIVSDDMRRWIEAQVAARNAGTAYEFVIEQADGRFLGACGLNQIDTENRRANLGYWVRTSAARRGVATTAVRQLVDWGFDHTDLVRMEIIVSTHNAASLRTASKAGAEREGVLRSRLWLHGVAHDAVVFSIIRP